MFLGFTATVGSGRDGDMDGITSGRLRALTGQCALGLVLALAACGGEDVATRELELFATYTNTSTSLGPSIDLGSASPEIDVSRIVLTVEPPVDGRVQIVLSNLKFFDSKSAFKVELQTGVKTEEFRTTSEEYVQDVENTLEPRSRQKTSVILVLDVSLSLGDEIQNVKQYAQDFIDLVMARSEVDATVDTDIGIVGFSDALFELPLTNDADSAKQFIEGLRESGRETKLYEAAELAADMMSTVDDTDGRAVVIFTDGNNNSCDLGGCTVERAVEKLEVLEGVSVFVIAFTGNQELDRRALELLAVGGSIEFPKSPKNLEEVFGRFAQTVSEIYTLVYDRNDSLFEEPIELRFTFEASRIK